MSFEVSVELPTKEGEIDLEKLNELVEWTDRETEAEYCVLNGSAKRSEESYLEVDTGRWFVQFEQHVEDAQNLFFTFGWYLTPTDSNKNHIKDMYEFLGFPEFSGGISLSPDQFSEVVEKTVNDDGRISVGTKYAGKTVKAVVIEEDE